MLKSSPKESLYQYSPVEQLLLSKEDTRHQENKSHRTRQDKENQLEHTSLSRFQLLTMYTCPEDKNRIPVPSLIKNVNLISAVLK